VSNTQPVAYDGHVLTVGARNVFTRDWLESRLESTVERMLIGILNAQVKVRFVVANVGGESGDE
jgi:chromosomal replication initiation ATPase DnaA